MRDATLGVLILLFSLFALGTWPALLDLSSLYGRHPCHAYLEYSSSVLFTAALLAAASGQSLAITGFASVGLAAAGGVLLMLGNLSMQRAFIMGVPLAIVLPLQGSLTVVLGTSLNYGLQPERSHPRVLASGVGGFLAAILLSAAAHAAYERDDVGGRERLRRRRQRPKGTWCCDAGGEGLITLPPSTQTCESSPTACCSIEASSTPPQGDGEAAEASANAPEPSDDASASGRVVSASLRGASAAAGLCVATLGGCCFGFFSPAFNLAVNDELHWIAESGGQPLPVFAANLYFCAAFTASAWAANLALMRWPPPGTERSSLWRGARSIGEDRGLAALAGMVCALGNAAQFWGGALAGFAAADLVQAFPLVGTFWGVWCLGEFRGASARVRGLLAAMYTAFVAAVVLLAASARA